MLQEPRQIELAGAKQYRVIPSVYPAINFFEDLVDPSDMEALWEIESLTNDRIRHETGDIFLVAAQDRISGLNSSVVMAAFTHISTDKSSRFSDGHYGVYYAGLTMETAVRETVYHREQFLSATNQQSCEIAMRLYEGVIQKPLHDVRGPEYSDLHLADDYSASQRAGRQLRDEKSWGLIYNSVRHNGGSCVAIFRPPAISKPKPISHLRYRWNGKKIVEVLSTQVMLRLERDIDGAP